MVFKATLLLFVLSSLFFPNHSHAQWCAGNLSMGVDTALGCLQTTSPEIFVGQILDWGFRLSALAVFGAVVYAGFLITTASGDPKRVKAGQELITSAITGALLIGLSALILNFIGINVLGLGALGF